MARGVNGEIGATARELVVEVYRRPYVIVTIQGCVFKWNLKLMF